MPKRKRYEGFSLLLQLASDYSDVFREILKYVDARALSRTCRLLRTVCLPYAKREFVRRVLILNTVDAYTTDCPNYHPFTLNSGDNLKTDSQLDYKLNQCLTRFNRLMAEVGGFQKCFIKRQRWQPLSRLMGKVVDVNDVHGIIAWEHFPGETEYIQTSSRRHKGIRSFYWMTQEWIYRRRTFLAFCREADVNEVMKVCCWLKCLLRPTWQLRMHTRQSIKVYPMEAWWSVERTGMNIYCGSHGCGIIVHVESFIYGAATNRPEGDPNQYIMVYLSTLTEHEMPVWCHGVDMPSCIPEVLTDNLFWISKNRLKQPPSRRRSPVQFSW